MADEQVIGKGRVDVVADTTKVDTSIANLPKKFATVEVAAQKMGAEIQRSSGNAAMGLMMVSQFVDDMQFGFRSVVNNVPSLGMAVGSALGMSSEAAMKFGGALGIAAVAVNLLITHWDTLMDSMGLGKVLTEAEQMEQLAKATRLTADEQERLNRFRREEAARSDLTNKRASGVEKTEAQVKQAIADLGDEATTGRSKLVAGLVQARRAQGLGTKMDPEEERQLGIIQRDFGGTKYGDFKEKELRKKIQDRLDKEDTERAGRTVDTAVFDSQRRKQLLNEIKANPGAFPAGAADALGAIQPAKNIKDQEAADLAKKQAEQLDEANRADFERWQKARDKEDSRLAGALMGSVGTDILKGDQDIEGRVRTALEKAGFAADKIGEAVEGTAKKLKEKMDEAVEKRALNRGLTEDQARQQFLQEADERNAKRLGVQQQSQPQSEVMSTETYLNKLLVASAGGKQKDEIPRDQLKEAQTTNKLLGNVIKELAKPKTNEGVPTFARGRAR